MVLVSLESHNLRLDLAALHLTRALVLGDETRSDGDEVADLKNTLQDSATCDTTLEVLSVRTRVVDIEGTNNNHLGRRDEVTHGEWNSADVVDDEVDVVATLSRDRKDGRTVSNGTLNELLDILVLLDARVLIFDDNVNLILQDDDLVEVHDLDGGKMLRRLRLRAGLVASDE
jgi:hypothetical protein